MSLTSFLLAAAKGKWLYFMSSRLNYWAYKDRKVWL